MTEQMSEGGLIRYYCTAGNGMESFLVDEVKKKLAAENVYQMPGKVLFSSSARINKISELKAAERLFLLLKQGSPVRLSAYMSPAKAVSVLQSRLLGDRNEWISAVMTWSHLQEELASRRTNDIITSKDLGVMRKGKEGRGSTEQREEEEKCHVQDRNRTGEQMDEESENRRLRSGEENGVQTQQEKRKRDSEERGIEGRRVTERKWEEGTSGETCFELQTLEKKKKGDDGEEQRRHAAPHSSNEKNAEKDKTSERERCEGEKEQMRMFVKFSGVISGTHFNGGSACDNAASGLDHSVESSSRSTDDFDVQRVKSVSCLSPCNKVKSTGGGGETLLQPEPEPPSRSPVSFRISCKCTGSLSRLFNSQEVSKRIGAGLSRLLGWKADLKNPQLEIHVYLSDDHCLLGIPLTRMPLANRSYIKTTGLRSTIAWAMASLAQIQPGFCVVDPMCGVGTILIEAAQEHKNAFFLGMDIDDGQLQKANKNVEFAELGNGIHLLKASSMVLPLPSASVDAVVCDLPFGRKFGSKTNMAANLPVIVTEMERVLCTGGSLVLLLSPQLSCLLKKLLTQKDTGSTSNQETKPQTGIQDCPSPPSLYSTKLQTFQIPQGVKSSFTQETDLHSELKHSASTPLSSLKHQATLRVSLGAIDGLIHKYVKTDA